MVRRTSQIFLHAEEEKQQKHFMRRNVSRIKLGYDVEQEVEKTSGEKCSCG